MKLFYIFMGIKTKMYGVNEDVAVEVVITSYNQRAMIREAVQSVCEQTVLPQRIIIVDDGSQDAASAAILEEIEKDKNICVPLIVHRQQNCGVSAARNAGIRMAQTPFVLVLDGDDRIKPEFIQAVSKLLQKDEDMIAASAQMQTFGALNAVSCPTGGTIEEFLSHNCCPATHILKREIFEMCGGYDETMRGGFEDWEFFLTMLETSEKAHIGIVDRPLLQYRTAPASSNVKSMNQRTELMQYIIDKHMKSYCNHIVAAILGVEKIADERLYNWENEVLHTLECTGELSETATHFLENPTYGDGGVAAAVRMVSQKQRAEK